MLNRSWIIVNAHICTWPQLLYMVSMALNDSCIIINVNLHFKIHSFVALSFHTLTLWLGKQFQIKGKKDIIFISCNVKGF